MVKSKRKPNSDPWAVTTLAEQLRHLAIAGLIGVAVLVFIGLVWGLS